MNETPAQVQPAPAALPDEAKYLKDIAEHLQSIRSMMKFFTFILVLAILGQILSFFTSF